MGNDRFLSMFFEEARELLQALESGLMGLEAHRDDPLHLDRTFRAAHTLKGAAGMVGLPAIAEFTHVVESVLDGIRGGRIPVEPALITTLLASKDHLVEAVEAGADATPPPAPPDLVARLTAVARGESLAEAAPTPQRPANPTPPSPSSKAGRKSDDGDARRSTRKRPPTPRKSTSATLPSADEEASVALAPPEATPERPFEHSTPGIPSDVGRTPKSGPTTREPVSYRIRLTPALDVLRKGINPLGILDELRELGEAQVVADWSRVPPLEDLDPRDCHLSWTISLRTDADRPRLDEVFLFLDDPAQVSIEVNGDSPSPSLVPEPAPIPEPTPASPKPPGVEPRGREAKSSRVRVEADQLDELVGMAGELAILADSLSGLRDLKGVGPWVGALEALERIGRRLRDTTLELRMVPMEELFVRFPRVVRDLASRSRKQIVLKIEGEETRLDRTIIERLADPMIHLIRNAVDHGLEPADERIAAGKPSTGRITIAAGYEGDRVAIRIEDDGRGLDRSRIVRKALDAGLLPPGTSPDDPRVGSVIFEPGFSTRDKAGELSGRGVGLDVVRDTIHALRGSVTLRSVAGGGTTFLIHLPLTLAMIDGLLIEVGEGRYVVPIAQVEECVAVAEDGPGWAMNRQALSVREALVPLVSLRRAFHVEGVAPRLQEILLTVYAEERVGVVVDRLLGRVQAVIQPLDDDLGGPRRFSGATILGDGSVCLILDLASLVGHAHNVELTPRMVSA